MASTKKPLVGILMGSKSDAETMRETEKILKEHKIPYEVNILSTHRTPDKLRSYAKSAKKKGLKVLVCGAGGSAALAGIVSAYTDLPVIGVPIKTEALDGLDSLLSTVQMPAGVPVATMSVGKSGAGNAAIFVTRILNLCKPEL